MNKRDPFSPTRVKDVVKNNGIRVTEQQLLAVTWYLSGCDKKTSLAKAGYQNTVTNTLFDRASTKAAIRVILDDFMHGEAAPAALRALYMIVSDDRTAAGVRVQAANSLLDRAGYTAKKAEAGDSLDDLTDLASLSAEQLQARIDKLDAALSSKTLDVQPDDVQNSVPVSSQDLEIYE
ncbi:hypothetical protein [Brucella anthropi]|uniref:hypothetical protein n=1 Tax=Brucella anthropi TaxID=529 RepID=UPI001CFC53F3|nr:hypothetical protein [Brucella anthropi]